jgi:hypothetical protein
MTTSFIFFDGFATQNGDMGLVLWFCCKEGDSSNVVTFLYGGGVMEKAMVEGDFFSFIFFYLYFLWCFWFNSLELIMMVVFFFVETWNGQRRRLRRNGGGLLEIEKENVVASD